LRSFLLATTGGWALAPFNSDELPEDYPRSLAHKLSVLLRDVAELDEELANKIDATLQWSSHTCMAHVARSRLADSHETADRVSEV
jgi:hypothetical protein